MGSVLGGINITLDEHLKLSRKPQQDEYTPVYGRLNKLQERILTDFEKNQHWKAKIGFLPITVWYADWGKWRPIMKEYKKLLISLDSSSASRKRSGTIASSYGGDIAVRTRLHTSFRNPAIDEQIFRYYGKPGWKSRNIFHDYGIEAIISTMYGMDYRGTTVNEALVRMNKRFIEEHDNLVPEGMSIDIQVEDATKLPDKDNSCDLIWSSPPYYGAEKYPSGHPNEMSQIGSYHDFLDVLQDAADEAYRILRPSRMAIIQVGNTRVDGEFVHYAHDTINLFVNAGFKIWDEAIMVNRSPHIQVNCGRSVDKQFLINSHEYLIAFKKE